jgi:hypothetical protein
MGTWQPHKKTVASRRLAGITQVVSPAERHVFHNRLSLLPMLAVS